MPNLYSIKVILPSDRAVLGTLELLGAGGVTLAGPFWVYGKADGGTAKKHENPSRSRTVRFGDTPLGGYSVTRIEPTGNGTPLQPADSYGPNGALCLEPISGEADLAKANGRSGLLIHGGRRAPTKQSLRPTNGCIRMSDSDISSLIQAIQNNGIPLPIDLIVIAGQPSGVPNLIAGDDDGYDSGDPPPT